MTQEIRPWGKYEVLVKEKGMQVKRVELNPKARLSLQRHSKRSENWIIVSGKGLVTLDKQEKRVAAGDYIQIPENCIHRIANGDGSPLVFIEVQLGNYLEEDDIQRYEDDYGRCP